jgi:hypothetical protein
MPAQICSSSSLVSQAAYTKLSDRARAKRLPRSSFFKLVHVIQLWFFSAFTERSGNIFCRSCKPENVWANIMVFLSFSALDDERRHLGKYIFPGYSVHILQSQACLIELGKAFQKYNKLEHAFFTLSEDHVITEDYFRV